MVLLLICLVVPFGCKGKDKGKEAEQKSETKPAEGKVLKKYPINYMLTEEKRVQDSVDTGHQTWRNNPEDVAHAALINQGVNVKIEDCRVAKKVDETHAVVAAASKENTFEIFVEKVVRPDGIWTATEIDITGGTLEPKYDDNAMGILDEGAHEHASQDSSSVAADGADAPASHDHSSHNH